MQFGMYLVDNGIISSEEFYEALKLQVHSRPQLGALAIESGRLSFRQVFNILRAQCESPSGMFGELAVTMGYLTEQQLAQLLADQTARAQPFADVLVELEILSAEEVDRHYAEYRQCLKCGAGEPALAGA